MNCDTSCAGSWGYSRKTFKGLYEQKLWKDLAIEVARVGFRSDQTYFYLGQAAEGLGNTEAARTYYKLGLVSHKCNGFVVNNCDGFVFPKDILDAMNRLPPPTKAKEPAVVSSSNLANPTENNNIVKKIPDEVPQVVSDSRSDERGNDSKLHQEKQLKIADKRKVQVLQDQEAEQQPIEQEKEVSQQEKADLSEALSNTKARAMIRKATKQERSLIISAVSRTLFDSESARYLDIYLIPNSFACVEVNAKNRFGGYTGFQNIVATFISGSWFSLNSLKDTPISCFDLIAEMHVTRN